MAYDQHLVDIASRGFLLTFTSPVHIGNLLYILLLEGSMLVVYINVTSYVCDGVPQHAGIM